MQHFVGNRIINDLPPWKVLFLGDRSIGKTTLIRTFCDYMHDAYNCEIFNGSFLIFKQFLYYDKRGPISFPIQILDLPGGTTVESRKDQYPAKAHTIVLCFAIDDPISLTNIYNVWLPECREYYGSRRHRFNLLGLRSDCRKCPEKIVKLWGEYRDPITSETGRRFHQDCGIKGMYLECSAEENLPETITAMTLLINNSPY